MTEIDFACSTEPGALEERAANFDSLARQLLARRKQPLKLTLEFPAAAARDVHEFVAEESRCCPFFSFEVDKVDRRLRLAISTPPGGEALLDALEASFAGDRSKLRTRLAG